MSPPPAQSEISRFTKTNDIQLHYLDYPGGNPPLVLLPGLTANAYCFAGVVQAGLSPRYRVLALDLRGRGLSDKPDTGYGLAEHAADVIGLLDALNLDQVVLGGHSFGALLSIYLAAHFPTRISNVIIIDAAATVHPDIREMIKPVLARLGKVIPSWEVYLAGVKQMPQWGGRWDATIEQHYRADVQTNADGTVQSQSPAQAIAEAADQSSREDWSQHVAAVRQPALLLNALGPFGPPGAPPILSFEQAKKTVDALGNCRYVEIPGNHMSMLYFEGARRMAEAIAQFVG